MTIMTIMTKNIFQEFIDRRAQYNEVCLLIDAIHDGHFEVVAGA